LKDSIKKGEFDELEKIYKSNNLLFKIDKAVICGFNEVSIEILNAN